MRTVLALCVLLGLAACSPSSEPAKAPPPRSAAKAAEPVPNTPVLSGVGTVASVEGLVVVLDHEAVTGGLPAGRNAFRGYGDVLAEAPLEPGARVSFSYQDWKPRPVLTELKAR
jgi:hypothetical protein